MRNELAGRRRYLQLLGAGTIPFVAGCSTFERDNRSDTFIDEGDWPLSQHDTMNTNHNAKASSFVERPAVRWRASVSEESERDGRPQPVVSSGTVYVGGNSVTAYDLQSGNRTWRHEAKGRFYSPSIVGGRLYVTKWDAGRLDVESYDVNNEEPIWNMTIRSSGARRPTSCMVTRDLIVLATRGSVYGVDVNSRDHKWTVAVDSHRPVRIARDRINLFYTSNSRLQSIDVSAGRIESLIGRGFDRRWTQKLQLPLQGAPVGVRDRILVNTSPFVPNHDLNNGVLYSVDVDRGEIQWKIETGAYGFSPAIKDSKTFVATGWHTNWETTKGTHSGEYKTVVQSVDIETGELDWRREISNHGIRGSPVVAANTVLASMYDHRSERDFILGFDAENGEVLWRLQIGHRVDSLAVTGDKIITGGADGTVSCLG